MLVSPCAEGFQAPICGDNLTRENAMKQAANLKEFSSDVLLPGIKSIRDPMTSFRSSRCS